MRAHSTLLPLLVIAALCAACAGAPAPTTKPGSPFDLLKAKEPGTDWRRENSLEADLDQDGVHDFAFTGIRGDRFLVGIVQGPPTARSQVWTLDFPWNGGEDALCSKEARIALEPLEENEGPTSKGPRKGLGINLHDDQCDAFHIAWNPDDHKFEWWRL